MGEQKSLVHEMGFTLSRAADLQVNVLDVAGLHGIYRDRFPLFQQMDLLPPMILPVVGQPFFQPMQSAGQIPRLWFMAPDSKLMLQIQSDRFCMNWRRLAPVTERAEYPGYAALSGQFFDEFKLFQGWAQDRGSEELALGELFYINHVPISSLPPPGRISSALTFFNPNRTVPVANLGLSWTEFFGDNNDAMVSVACDILPDQFAEMVIRVQITTRFHITGLDAGATVASFATAHEKIHELLPAIFMPDILRDMNS